MLERLKVTKQSKLDAKALVVFVRLFLALSFVSLPFGLFF